MRKRFRKFRWDRADQPFRKRIHLDDNILAVGKGADKTIVFLDAEKVPTKELAVQIYGLNDNIEYRISEPFKSYANSYWHRPFMGGDSTADVLCSAGTASLLVFDKISGKPVELSNAHVLAMNADTGVAVPIGTDIWQPGPFDLGTSNDHVGDLLRFEKPGTNQINKIDAAIASLLPLSDSPTGLMMTHGIRQQGYVSEIADAYIGQQVRKNGRTTDWDRRGHVTITDLTVKVGYPPERNPRICTFEDCILVEDNNTNRHFSSPGDSGSSVLDFSNNALIGLLFAGSSAYTIICKIKNVFEQMSLELIPPPEITRTIWLDLSHWQGDITAMNFLTASNAESNQGYYDADAIQTAVTFGVTKANITGLNIQSFQSMKDKGVEGVIIKFSQGITLKDDRAAEYYDYAKAVGMRVGAYHFVDPQFSAQLQFDNFIAAIGSRTLDFLALDCEIYSYKDNQTVTSVIQSLAAKVSNWHGKKCMIYTSPGFWNSHTNAWSGWKNYPLWLAFWSPYAMLPVPPRDWTLAETLVWQHEVNPNGAYWGVSSKSVDMNTTFYSRFKPYLDGNPVPPGQRYKISTTISGNGTVTFDPSTPDYDAGATVKVTATASAGWHFANWSDDLVGNDNPTSIVMDGDKSIVAVFEEDAPPPSDKTVFNINIFRGKALVNRPYRMGPGTSYTLIGTIPSGKTLDIFEEVSDTYGNLWVRIGYNEWTCMIYRGVTYIDWL